MNIIAPLIALGLLTYKPAEWLTARIVKEGDSFGSNIVVNNLCTVFLMSIFLTVIGTWIGSRTISMDPIHMFFYKWPRNFAVSLAVELFVAQPIVRLDMLIFIRRKIRPGYPGDSLFL